jgi:GT2 family glycosyltransferase
MAHTEIFILNYNGAHYLYECLSSLSQIELGPHTVSVSVVDNNSSDLSADVTKGFPAVNFIKLDNNYGFSQGNNLGVKARLAELAIEGRSADILCFLNNDTRVEKGWLIAAIERFNSDPKIGVVGSKALFYDRFVELEVTPLNPSAQVPRVYLRGLEECVNLHSDPKRSKWLGWDRQHQFSGVFATPAGARALLAAANSSSPMVLNLVFENKGSEAIAFKVRLASREISLNIAAGDAYQISEEIPNESFIAVVQNAGSFVTAGWEAGDIGMFKQDLPDADKPSEVAAICGVSMFIRRELFQALGGFDRAFFAYFEDTDLSLRARIKGYRCWFEPRSILNHIHCGSGGEWSPYFNFNVTYSHLLFASRWMGWSRFALKFLRMSKCAWRELRAFAEDQNLETKPNLRTLVRFIKQPLLVPTRRVYHILNWRRIINLGWFSDGS